MKGLLSNRLTKLLTLQNASQNPSEKPAEINLYSAQTIDSLEWPNNAEGDHAKSFLLPLIQKGMQHYIENVQTEMRILKFHDYIFPITINQREYDNSYVCSPYAHYVSYAMESLDVFNRPWIKKGLVGLLYGLGKILKWGQINQIIIVNNWPFSTNLHPSLTEEMVAIITNYLKQHFPSYAILFRSIDSYLNQNSSKVFKKNGFHLLASRQVYFTDAKKEEIFQTRIFKSDLRLLKKSDYEIVDNEDLSPEDYARVLDLYSALYIGKYSNLNPKFNTHFVELAIKNKTLHLKALKKNGTIDGVVGYLYRYGILFCPFFGYDISKPQEIGLYRLLSTILMLEAQKRQALFHQSSGASFYKTVRRAEGVIEYLAVYHQHLPRFRRIPWFILQSISNSIGIPFMKKY